MTTRLLFSKLLLILLFSRKILIFFKNIWVVQTYYWTPSFILEVQGPPGPPNSAPHGLYYFSVPVQIVCCCLCVYVKLQSKLRLYEYIFSINIKLQYIPILYKSAVASPERGKTGERSSPKHGKFAKDG